MKMVYVHFGNFGPPILDERILRPIAEVTKEFSERIKPVFESLGDGNVTVSVVVTEVEKT
jgi:hypothetical protein